MYQPFNTTANIKTNITSEMVMPKQASNPVQPVGSTADAQEQVATAQSMQAHNIPLFFLHKHLSIALVREKNRFGKTQWGLDVQVKHPKS